MSRDDDPSTVAGAPYTLYRQWKSWSPENFGRCDEADTAYFRAEISSAGCSLEPGDAVLEIGFGNGKFATWIRSIAAHYVGTELDPEALKLASQHGFEVYPATLDLREVGRDRRFKLVVAFDVFEHLTLDECVAVLRSAADVLSEGGMILARVPSGDSPFGRSIQHGDMTHRTVIGSGIARQLATLAGLTAKQIRSPVFPVTGMGARTFVRRMPVAILRRVASRVINTVFHDNEARVVTANMIMVFSKP